MHWEDFENENGFKFLQRYRSQGPIFNDDIQSTAAVALASVLGACRMPEVLHFLQQTFLIVGAGQAGLGIAALLKTALVQQV